MAQGGLETESISNYAERIVELLAEAGVQAEAKPYVRPDAQGLSGITGGDGPTATARVRVGVMVHRRDQARAEEIVLSQPKAQPISDEELSRLAEEAGQHQKNDIEA